MTHMGSGVASSTTDHYDWQTDLLSIPTIILAFLSLLACIYVCISAMKHGYIPCKRESTSHNSTLSGHAHGGAHTAGTNKASSVTTSSAVGFKKHHIMMIDIIFWMCVTDGVHNLPMILNWWPQAFHMRWFWSAVPCKLIGVLAQFCAIQSPSWHILLAYHLGYLLCGGSLFSLNSQRKYHFLIVNIFPFCLTVLPLCFDAFGEYSANDDIQDRDCWLKKVGWQLVQAYLILASLVVHWIVLMIAFIQWKKSFVAFSSHYRSIVVKLCRFIVVYSVIRIPPQTERIWESFGSPPLGLILAHHIGITIIGSANALVWYINQRERSTGAMSMDQYKRKQQRNQRGGGYYANNNNNKRRKAIKQQQQALHHHPHQQAHQHQHQPQQLGNKYSGGHTQLKNEKLLPNTLDFYRNLLNPQQQQERQRINGANTMGNNKKAQQTITTATTTDLGIVNENQDVVVFSVHSNDNMHDDNRALNRQQMEYIRQQAYEQLRGINGGADRTTDRSNTNNTNQYNGIDYNTTPQTSRITSVEDTLEETMSIN